MRGYTYWNIGREIVEYEKANKEHAGYGSELFDRIAKDLKMRYGREFSRSNVFYMRLLYLKYPKSQTLSDQLTWSHYISLLMIDDDFKEGVLELSLIFVIFRQTSSIYPNGFTSC
ncbi:conserved hypothetical protein [groundwater metagenome]|uniref:YhcG N-terminal domain-containing protein n=1 Tax=groundwater metagenome TaxID=717931 RepID=A0A098EB94_9ZZZZ